MTQTPEKPAPAAKAPFWIDFGPIAIFVGIFQVMRRVGDPDMAIYWATGASMVAILIAVLYSKFIIKHISGQLILTAVLLIVMGALTIGLKNDAFIKLKPTILNSAFGLAILIGIGIGKNPIQYLMGSGFEMANDKWRTFGIRWALFFFASAALNVVIWQNFSEDFWVNFKIMGFLPLTFLFVISQMPFLLKHSDITEKTQSDPEA